jgi:spoIIIJ-associated protein
MSTPSKSGAQSAGAVTIEAKSLEQALVKAAGVLGVTQDEVEYQVTRETAVKGLLSFFKTPLVEIKAWVRPARPEREGRRGGGREERRGGREERRGGGREERREARAERPRPAPRPEREARPSYGEDDDEMSGVKAEPLPPEKVEALKEELREFCAGICAQIAGEPVQVVASVDDGRLVLNIENEAIAQQIHKNSKLAEALEHILRKKPRHLKQELPFRIFVDVSGVRRKREEELVQMAHDLSAKVHENKRPIVLNYKSSYDRKIIHMALDKDERVYTKSIGSGPNRKLMILPIKDMAGGAGAEPEVYERGE